MMKSRKKYSLIFIFLTAICLQCSPTSNPLQKNEIERVTILFPENGATNIPFNSELIWEVAEAIDEYEVQLSDQANFSHLIVHLFVDSNRIDINGLPHNTTIYWRVRTVVKDKHSQWSEISQFKTESESVNPEPVKTILKTPSDDSVDQPLENSLEWTFVVNAVNYQLQISKDENFQNLFLERFLDKTSYALTDLDWGQTYYWRVLAHVEESETTWSDVWNFKTLLISIPPVTLISPPNNATVPPSDLLLEWEEIEDIVNYRVQVAKNHSFTNIAVDEVVNKTNLELTQLENGETYYWRVQAPESETWSEIWKFTTESHSSMNDFVSVRNSDFVIDEKVIRFAGTNAYYLSNYEKFDPEFVDRTLDIFEESGISVIRMWAFYDGYDCGYSQYDTRENVIQTSPGEYNESALQDLDRVIAKGKNRGIRFILPFINYWDELGGICQYNRWDGAANPSTNMAHFINSSNTQEWYKNYIKMLLNRVNTVTGIAYKDEPAIFAWEIINEGRARGQDPLLLRNWYSEIAKYIKSIDKNHLLSTGEEGFDEGMPDEYSLSQYSNTYPLRANEGTSFLLNSAIPEIDFLSAHWYPLEIGFRDASFNDLIKAQHAWLSDHQKIALINNKPLLIGEYGFASSAGTPMEELYIDFWSYSEQIGLNGSLMWQFVVDDEKCYEVGSNICWPDGRHDTDLYNSFKKHIQNINVSN